MVDMLGFIFLSQVALMMICVSAITVVFTIQRITILFAEGARRKNSINMVQVGEVVIYRHIDGSIENLTAQIVQAKSMVPVPSIEPTFREIEDHVDNTLVVDLYEKGTTIASIASSCKTTVTRIKTILKKEGLL